MIIHMARSTLVINDRCLTDLKRLAAERHQTLSAVVDEFLREGLRRARAAKRQSVSVVLPSYPMGKPKVNLADRDQLLDVMEGR